MSDTPRISVLVAGKDNPALVPSGYGKILQYATPYLMEAGYDVRLHCQVGHQMGVIQYEDERTHKTMEVWSGGDGLYGEGIVPAHLNRLGTESGKPALYFFVGDVPALNEVLRFIQQGQIMGTAWGAVDWEWPTPKHALDKWRAFYHPFTMSHHGCDVLRRDGLSSLLEHVYPGVNTDIWKPQPKDGDTMRAMGFVDDGFNVFSCFANQFMRKHEADMLQVVGEFHKRHPDAKIRFYGLTQTRRDWDMNQLAEHLGVQDLVRWSDDYTHIMGGYSEQDVARMMAQADVVLSLGYEGFGFQTCEAQALGVPVIGFGAGATPELLKGGILVPPSRDLMMAPMFRRPIIDQGLLLQALETMWQRRGVNTWGQRGREWVQGNLTWEHTGRALVDRIRTIEQGLVDEEVFGPPTPGPRGLELAQQVRVVE